MARHLAKEKKNRPKLRHGFTHVTRVKMTKEPESEKFSSMNVAGLKKYLEKRGVTVHGYLKPALIAIATAVNKIMLKIDPNFECHDAGENLENRLIIHAK